jgi:hypothetical protein
VNDSPKYIDSTEIFTFSELGSHARPRSCAIACGGLRYGSSERRAIAGVGSKVRAQGNPVLAIELKPSCALRGDNGRRVDRYEADVRALGADEFTTQFAALCNFADIETRKVRWKAHCVGLTLVA